MARMRVVQVAEPNGPWEMVERDIPEPGPGEVRVKGVAADSEDALAGVRPMIETVPLEQAAEAFERMMRGDARFRVVLTASDRP